MDILAALAAAPPSNPNGGRCKVQKVLDRIPDDTANKDKLVAVANDGTGEWSRLRTALVFTNLGLPLSATSIANHRNRSCACYGIGS